MTCGTQDERVKPPPERLLISLGSKELCLGFQGGCWLVGKAIRKLQTPARF